VPLICLGLGYWIVAARPHDLNAWLVLFLLSATQALFGNLDYSFWGGASLVIFGLFNAAIQTFLLMVLLWFGIYFPERWRADRRWPWVKWVILAIYCCLFVIGICGLYATEFAVAQLPRLTAIGAAADKVGNWLNSFCIVVFLIALIDKWRTVSIADARRRLRVLAIGSALSLGPILIIFAVIPLFGIDPHHGNWFMVLIPLIVLFPLTLAYVVVVQRAMELRILLRMGTKYLLAKATIILLQAAFAGEPASRLGMDHFSCGHRNPGSFRPDA
jgi:sigma-B regulation protein RsbU (phosphoserine phosphatase)